MSTRYYLNMHLKSESPIHQEYDYSYCYAFYVGLLDRFTYSYISPEELFQEVERDITKKIVTTANSSIKLAPKKLFLGEDGVYISRGESKIMTIFKKVKVKENYIDVEEAIKSRLSLGLLPLLFKIDKEIKNENPDFDMVLENCRPEIKEKIECGFKLNEEEQNAVLSCIKEDPRFRSIFKFLLYPPTNYEKTKKNFIENIPFKKNKKEKGRIEFSGDRLVYRHMPRR